MTCSTRFLNGLLLLGLSVALCGCLHSGQSALDEEKDPHFLAGKSRVNALDYMGAIECFEKAIQANPRSASAHFEVGLLYERNKQDFAAAIYHFQRFLELRPKSDYADVVKPRILACKQELAKTVSLGPVTQSLQREFEQLSEQNKHLREEVERWRNYALRLQALTNTVAQTAPVPQPVAPSRTAIAAQVQQPAPAVPTRVASASSISSPAPAASGRTHQVKPGETPAAIARKYGLRVDALLAANPRLDARRMQVGYTLTLPQ